MKFQKFWVKIFIMESVTYNVAKTLSSIKIHSIKDFSGLRGWILMKNSVWGTSLVVLSMINI
jgi:hypothetical protein